MKIIITPHNWHPQMAGGEVYLHRLCKALQSKGHEITCIAYCDIEYEWDGIKVLPQGKTELIFATHNELFANCDLVIHQLQGNPYGYNKANQHNKANILISHNSSKHYFVTRTTGIVYNSLAMAALGNYPDNESTVLYPLVNYRDYKKSKGRKIAIINCNENKGVHQFIALAKMLPQYQFVGYKGAYGEQICQEMPNVQWKENGVIDWSEIGILLVMSQTESWSMSAQEAFCCGIPVICSDLPGLRENLSYAGVYIDRNNLTLYAEMIIELMSSKRDDKYLQRAKELDPLPLIDAFNEWLIKFVNK